MCGPDGSGSRSGLSRVARTDDGALRWVWLTAANGAAAVVRSMRLGGRCMTWESTVSTGRSGSTDTAYNPGPVRTPKSGVLAPELREACGTECADQ